MSRLDVDYLLYAMTHVARKARDEADRRFAEQLVNAARNPWFKPSNQQAQHMAAVEARLYDEEGQA